MRGYIYILVNPSYPKMVKVGFTTRKVSDRCAELSASTGVPTSFISVFEEEVTNASEAESKVHAFLEGMGCRENSRREFFSISVSEAIKAVRKVLDANPEYLDLTSSTSEVSSASEQNLTDKNPCDALYWKGRAIYFGDGQEFRDEVKGLELMRNAYALGSLEAGFQLAHIDFVYSTFLNTIKDQSRFENSRNIAMQLVKNRYSPGFFLLYDIFVIDGSYDNIETLIRRALDADLERDHEKEDMIAPQLLSKALFRHDEAHIQEFDSLLSLVYPQTIAAMTESLTNSFRSEIAIEHDVNWLNFPATLASLCDRPESLEASDLAWFIYTADESSLPDEKNVLQQALNLAPQEIHAISEKIDDPEIISSIKEILIGATGTFESLSDYIRPWEIFREIKHTVFAEITDIDYEAAQLASLQDQTVKSLRQATLEAASRLIACYDTPVVGPIIQEAFKTLNFDDIAENYKPEASDDELKPSISRPIKTNASCMGCRERVFMFQNEHNEKRFFDSLGDKWNAHPCPKESNQLETSGEKQGFLSKLIFGSAENNGSSGSHKVSPNEFSLSSGEQRNDGRHWIIQEVYSDGNNSDVMLKSFKPFKDTHKIRCASLTGKDCVGAIAILEKKRLRTFDFNLMENIVVEYKQ